MVQQDLAITLAEYASSLRLNDLPASAVISTKQNIFDTMATAIAGSSAPGIPEVFSLTEEWGGSPQATVLVYGARVPAHHAAWVNGCMAHARDYDDTHDAAVLHAGVSVVPAALAAAELAGGVSGGDLIAAVTAGLDIVCRLGIATKVGITESGWIYTSIFGYFGATAAAGRVLGLTVDEMVNAIGITYSQVAGNHQVTRDAALTKRMQPGFAAKAALVSVQLAKKGIRGVQNTFQGEDGFFRVYLQNRYDPDVIKNGLGTQFEHEELSYKPYPCCRFNHAPIDAAIQAHQNWNLRPDQMRRVQVGVTRQCYEAVCTPVEVRKAPRSIVQAQFSIPYTVATALAYGKVGLADFTESGLLRPDVLDLANRVDGVVDESVEREWGRKISPAVLQIETHDGRILEHRVDQARGGTQFAMTEQDFDNKLADCIAFSAQPLAPGANERFRTIMNGLQESASIDNLIRTVSTRSLHAE